MSIPIFCRKLKILCGYQLHKKFNFVYFKLHRSKVEDCNADNLTFKVLGEFGKWQFWISIYMALLKLPLAWYQLNIIFMAPPQNFWCAKPEILTICSEEEWRQICSPVRLRK